MDSKEQKRAALYQKLKQLRSVSHSNAVNPFNFSVLCIPQVQKASIIVDATKYIEDLKEKVHRLNEEVSSSSGHNSLPMQVRVETLDKGFRINVFSEEDCPGLLVMILEAFEELGLDVGAANVSCAKKFHLEAIGNNDGELDAMPVDAQVVNQAVLTTIKKWSESND